MKKNYKKWLLLILIVICFTLGCYNDNLKQETENFVIDNTYDVIYNDLNSVIDEIQMFPTKDKEEKFIYYIKAIEKNHTKFTNSELTSISNLLNFEYNFSFNKLDYTASDFINDQALIQSHIK